MADAPINRPPGAKPLTLVQRNVLECIKALLAEMGIAPTYSELAERMGVSKVTVYEHVKALVEKGWIDRRRFASRAIEIRQAPSHCRCPECGHQLDLAELAKSASN